MKELAQRTIAVEGEVNWGIRPELAALPEYQAYEAARQEVENRLPRPATRESQGYPWTYVPGYHQTLDDLESALIDPALEALHKAVNATGLVIVETIGSNGMRYGLERMPKRTPLTTQESHQAFHDDNGGRCPWGCDKEVTNAQA